MMNSSTTFKFMSLFVTLLLLSNKVSARKDGSSKTECYDKWTHFRDAVSDSQGDQTFTICPGTTFYPDKYTEDEETYTAVWITASNIKIQCGKNGSYENNCVMDGGMSHITVGDQQLTGVEIKGIHFRNASNTSLNAWAKKKSVLTVTDCVWENNVATGGAAVNIWNNDENDSDAMTVVFNGCSFIGNKGGDGIILVEGGSVIVNNCKFQDNQDGWTMYVQSGGDANIVHSCFIDNFAPVYIYQDSVLINQGNSYGKNTANDEDYSECNGVYEEIAEGCSPFIAKSCPFKPIHDKSTSKTEIGIISASLICIALSIGILFIIRKKIRSKNMTKEADSQDHAVGSGAGVSSPGNTLRFDESDENGQVAENGNVDEVKPVFI